MYHRPSLSVRVGLLSALLTTALSVTAFAQGPVQETFGDATFEHFGYDVDIIGDVNGDGHPDYAATRQLLANISGNYVRILSGYDGTLIHQIDFQDGIGVPATAVDGIGDIDGDGAADLVVGMKGIGAWVISGGPGTILYDLGERVAFTSRFAEGVAGLGDFDGDGIGDIAVTDANFPSNGTVFIFSGATGLYLTGLASLVPGQFGGVVAGIGDIDGDGLGDIAVGNPDFNILLDTKVGAVFVYSATNTFQPMYSYYGNVAQDQLGMSLVGLGDIDGDNLDDFAIGSPYFDRTGGQGEVGLYSGATGIQLQAIQRDFVGFSIAGDFDFDQDGTSDVVGLRQGGVIEVYSTATGNVIYDSFPLATGSFADRPQDLNGDGFVDIVLGQPNGGNREDFENRLAGAVSVLTNTLELVGPPRIGTTPSIQLHSSTPGQSFLLLISRSQSPFALSAIDAADTRSLLLDPAQLLVTLPGTFDAQGNAQIPLAIPSSPALIDLTFYGQFVSLPGNPTIVDHLSNQLEVTIIQ
ncbi:MAG: integrin alpha [Planctomycetota bacterium]